MGSWTIGDVDKGPRVVIVLMGGDGGRRIELDVTRGEYSGSLNTIGAGGLGSGAGFMVDWSFCGLGKNGNGLNLAGMKGIVHE